MELVAACPCCGIRAKLPDDFPGGDLACPQCATVFPAPRPNDHGVIPLSAVPVATDPFAVWVGGTDGLPPIVPSEPEPEDTAAHLDWLKNETKQFNEFVAKQLAAIEKKKQEIIAAEAKVETAIIPRQQELNRQRAALTGRAAALKRREEAIRRREDDLGRLNVAIAAREADLLDCEDRLTALTDRVTDLERREQELRSVVTDYEEKRAEIEALAVGRAEVVRRQTALDRAEQAAQRRADELDELETQLRQEIDARERELIARQRFLDTPRDLVGEPQAAL
jgi:chromosome segregation ATPase